MPAKHTIKTYIAGGHYHVYNRGVEKRVIFTDSLDFHVFLKYLKDALDKPTDRKSLAIPVTLQGVSFKGIPRQPKNFHGKIQLIAYCLMPNHFHLLLSQSDARSIELFMRSVMTRYTGYFNKRYKRIGKLFQSCYKAASVDTDEYLLHLSRYIHRNPLGLYTNLNQAYSSYSAYLTQNQIPTWLSPAPVLDFFPKSDLGKLKKINSYQYFVEKYNQNDAETLGTFTLEDPE